MAILTEGRLLITDASNVPISGGKARIYNTGTTTPTPVFSDAALTVPLVNPVVANASGFTPVIFAAEGIAVDVQYLTAADAIVPGRSYTAVPLLGSDTGTFTRTMADNSRFKLSGSGGTVLMQAGDASPDNVGGKLTIEGWAGTQGDLLTLDFAATNTTGPFTENSKKMLGIVATASTSFTSVASVDIALAETPTGCRAWKVYLWDVISAAVGGSGVQFRFSYDGGATYKSGASDYGHAADYNVSATPTSAYDDTAAQIALPIGFSGLANRPQLIRFDVITPTSGLDSTILMGDAVYLDTGTGFPQRLSFGGFGHGGFGRATHVRVIFVTNNASGKYRVAPLRGFGEA